MKRRIISLSVFVLLASAAFVCLPEGAAGGEPAQRRRPARQRRQPARAARQRVDYSDFSHRTPQHQQRSCASCHQTPSANWARVRAREAAFPDITDYPAHASCLDCHRRQFYSGARPVICSVCHTVVSPRADARHPFQNPSELFARSKKRKGPSDFAVNFPHDRHQDVMARARPGEPGGVGFLRAGFARQEAAKEVDSCAICHQTFRPQGASTEEYLVAPPAELPENDLRVPAFWMKKGMLKTTPSSHAACFNCHWQEGGERPFSNECGRCHTLAPAASAALRKPADADPAHPSVKALGDADALEHWTGRSVARFKHEQGNHESVGCTSCHVTITSQSRLGPDTLDVPIQTCASSNCHGATRPPKNIIFREVEQRRKPEGASFQCAKCHLNYGREPTPKSHNDLFPAK